MTRRGHLADDSVDRMTAALTGQPFAAEPSLAGMMGGPAAAAPGPALEADAQLSVQIGRLAGALEVQRRDDLAKRTERSHAIFPFDFNPATMFAANQASAGASTLNNPGIYSPNEGYFWDIKKITAASFTAGTVSLYKNAANDANSEVVFTSAGSYFFGTGQLLLSSNDFLLFVAAGITGNVTISGRAIQVRADYLADYLL